MDWREPKNLVELQAASLRRPGMWVPRPYVDGPLTLWFGFGMGARDDGFERFTIWLQTTRHSAEDGSRSPLIPSALIQHAVAGDLSPTIADAED